MCIVISGVQDKCSWLFFLGIQHDEQAIRRVLLIVISNVVTEKAMSSGFFAPPEIIRLCRRRATLFFSSVLSLGAVLLQGVCTTAVYTFLTLELRVVVIQPSYILQI